MFSGPIPRCASAVVATLIAFAEAVEPDGIAFLNAPGDLPAQEPDEAFLSVLAAFRAAYWGPIAALGLTGPHAATATFARLNVSNLSDAAPIVPGWHAASIDLNAQPNAVAHADIIGANVVCGATGRLRLTGRAAPTGDGTMRAWLVFECGTLAADSAAGTLGFGILEIGGTTVTARPIRIDTDGSFTYRGTSYKSPPAHGKPQPGSTADMGR